LFYRWAIAALEATPPRLAAGSLSGALDELGTLGRLTLAQIFIGWNGIERIRGFWAVVPRQFHCTPCQLIATHAAGPKHHTISFHFACAFGVPFLRHFSAAFITDHDNSSLSIAPGV
jgi:hypothetical protein